MQEYVKLTTKNGVGTIEFFHPQSNALPSNILNKLASKITQAGEENNINVLVLKSAGDRAFCAGASFDELISIQNKDRGESFFSGFANVINAARKCPKFIIGRIQGKAVGGGVGMASATDYCFANKFSDVKLSELTIGIGPFVVGPAIERKIGKSAFSAMAINANKWFDAAWAKDKGLYNEIFETTQEMDSEIHKLSSFLSASNPAAMSQLKKIMWEGTDHWDSLLLKRAKNSGELILSKFAKDAIAKFKKK